MSCADAASHRSVFFFLVFSSPSSPSSFNYKFSFVAGRDKKIHSNFCVFSFFFVSFVVRRTLRKIQTEHN